MNSMAGRKKGYDKKSETSMKEVLGDIAGNVSGGKAHRRIDIREAIWNYPNFFSKLFSKFIPFSYIFVFGIVGIFLALFLQSKYFVNMVNGSGEGDTYVEGTVGAISSFNPLFTTNNYIDKSVQSLVFEKLIYIDKEGKPYPGIAKEWTSSENGKVYDFVIDDNRYWQDKTKLTVDDVVFTFNIGIKLSSDYSYDTIGTAIKDVKVEKLDERTVRFTLPEVNPTFFELVSVYIVPMDRLKDIDPRQLLFDSFTKYPIGSGKYKVVRTEDTAVYLKDNEEDSFNPQIKSLVFKIFPDMESLETSFRIGSLDAVGGWDRKLFDFVSEYGKYSMYEKKEVNRRRLLFLNTRKDSLKEKEIRQALNYMLDKDMLLNELEAGGYRAIGPIPEESWAYNSNIEDYEYNPSKAAELLGGKDYKKNENSGYYQASNGEILSFTLSYLGNETNDRLANILVDLYKKEGVIIKLERCTFARLSQEIIATRSFEILLSEVETTLDPDQYNLWHSLKSDYPNLNLSGYNYERVDILLEDARNTLDKETRKQKYFLFQKYLNADSPAIFLYSPSFVYYVRSNWKGIDLSNMNYSYDRFYGIENWKWEN